MTSKQIKIIVAGLIGLGILITLFVFGVKEEPELVVEDTLGEEQIYIDTESEEVEEETVTPEYPKPEQIFDAVKFNLAMKNAQKSFLDKNYLQSVSFYKEALVYREYDGVYAGLYTSYMVLGDWNNALASINSAIALNELNSDYWKWKILLLDEKMNTSFGELKIIYQEGLSRVHSVQRINLVTSFAGTAETNGEKTEAIMLWEKAIELNPSRSGDYQNEIDRLKK